MRNKLVGIVAALTVLLLAPGGGLAFNPCQSVDSATIGFINGVFTTEGDALTNLGEIKKAYSETSVTGVPVKYDLLYNDSMWGNWNFFQDAAETFEQRMDQLDPTGGLAERYELFWDSLRGRSWLGKLGAHLVAAVPGALQVLGTLYTDLTTYTIGSLAAALSAPPTEVTYEKHRAQIDSLAESGQRLLLVAHSQGNLFAVPAFDYAEEKMGPEAVRVVHVAPPSTTLRGPYLLADIDDVIGGLRLLAPTTVPEANFVIPWQGDNPWAHGFVETYLGPGLARLTDLLNEAIFELAPYGVQAGLPGGVPVEQMVVSVAWPNPPDYRNSAECGGSPCLGTNVFARLYQGWDGVSYDWLGLPDEQPLFTLFAPGWNGPTAAAASYDLTGSLGGEHALLLDYAWAPEGEPGAQVYLNIQVDGTTLHDADHELAPPTYLVGEGGWPYPRQNPMNVFNFTTARVGNTVCMQIPAGAE